GRSASRWPMAERACRAGCSSGRAWPRSASSPTACCSTTGCSSSPTPASCSPRSWANFYIVRQEDEVSLEPVVRAQVASHREVAHLDPGAWVSDGPDHGVVEPGIRLPDDQALTCDPQRRAPDCETLH